MNYKQIVRTNALGPIHDTTVLEKLAARVARAVKNIAGLKVLEIGPSHGLLLRKLHYFDASVYASDLLENYLDQYEWIYGRNCNF